MNLLRAWKIKVDPFKIQIIFSEIFQIYKIHWNDLKTLVSRRNGAPIKIQISSGARVNILVEIF